MDVLIAHGPLSLPARLALGCCSRRFGRVVLAFDRVKYMDVDQANVIKTLKNAALRASSTDYPSRMCELSRGFYGSLAKLRVADIDLSDWNPPAHDAVFAIVKPGSQENRQEPIIFEGCRSLSFRAIYAQACYGSHLGHRYRPPDRNVLRVSCGSLAYTLTGGPAEPPTICQILKHSFPNLVKLDVICIQVDLSVVMRTWPSLRACKVQGVEIKCRERVESRLTDLEVGDCDLEVGACQLCDMANVLYSCPMLERLTVGEIDRDTNEAELTLACATSSVRTLTLQSSFEALPLLRMPRLTEVTLIKWNALDDSARAIAANPAIRTLNLWKVSVKKLALFLGNEALDEISFHVSAYPSKVDTVEYAPGIQHINDQTEMKGMCSEMADRWPKLEVLEGAIGRGFVQPYLCTIHRDPDWIRFDHIKTL